MKQLIHIILVIASLFSITAEENKNYFPYSDGIPKEQFAVRRKQLAEKFSDNSFLIFLSADYYMTKRDINSKLVVSPNQYYLCGLPPQKSVLILIPSGFLYKDENIFEILFVQNQTPSNVIWNGPEVSIESTKEILGIINVFDLTKLDSVITVLAGQRDSVFIDKLSHTMHFSDYDNNNECDIEIINTIKAKKETIAITDKIPFLGEMRQVKDNYEIVLIQKAIDISIDGHISTIKNAKPNLFEYQLQSFMEFEFMFKGAEISAYPSIVGTGINTCYLHYMKNAAQIKDGDLVLMDCGANYHGYSADITRTFPISGKFTEEQRIIYEIVLEAQDSSFAVCKPGTEFRKIHDKAKELIKRKLTEIGILGMMDKVEAYFPHGTSHFLGLDVHDVGEKRSLESGMVLTVEPGIYIPAGTNCDKKWWNIGVRIEDDILITESGYINLSQQMPKTIVEIETLMKK